MTVSALYSPQRLAISGYDYDFSFEVELATHLLVYTITTVDEVETPTLLVYGTDYIVTLESGNVGGTVQTGSYVLAVWTPAEPSGDEILITRQTPLTQTTDIPVRGGFRESAIEGALDRLVSQNQELDYKLDQAIDVDPTAELTAIAAAQQAQALAEAAQAAAEVAQAAAEAAATGAIDDALDPTSGHDHDGVDAKKISVANLDVTGITDGQYIKRSGAGLAGAAPVSVEVLTVDGTWVCPVGVTEILLTMVGAGGGGGDGTLGSSAGGGGGGETVVDYPYTVIPGNDYVYQVGVKGAGNNASGAGGDGEDTIFDTAGGALTAEGGGGGASAGTGGTGGGGSLDASTNTGGKKSLRGGNGATAAGGGSCFGQGANGGGNPGASAAGYGAGGAGGPNGGAGGGDGSGGLIIIKY